MRTTAKTVLLVLLGVGVLAALVAHVGLAEVVRAVGNASPLHLGLAALAYGLFFLVRGLRWRLLFSQSAPDVRLSSTTGLTAVGWLANSVLPLKGGDVLRAALIAKRDKVHLAQGASTVALERVLDLLGLAAVAALGLALIPRAIELPPGISQAMALVWVLPVAAIATLFALVRFRESTMRLARRVLRPLGGPGEKLTRFGDTVLAGLHALTRHPVLLAKLLPLTLLVAILQACVFTFLVEAFMPGTPMGLAFGGSALFLLSFVVSITPGNVGTYEAAFAAVFVALGAAPEIAVPAAILTHLVTTLTVAVYGATAILALGLESSRGTWRPARAVQGGMP